MLISKARLVSTSLSLAAVGLSSPIFAAPPQDAPTVLTRGLAFIDRRAGEWAVKPFSFVNSPDHTCALSCHTTIPYVLTRAAIPVSSACAANRATPGRRRPTAFRKDAPRWSAHCAAKREASTGIQI